MAIGNIFFNMFIIERRNPICYPVQLLIFDCKSVIKPTKNSPTRAAEKFCADLNVTPEAVVNVAKAPAILAPTPIPKPQHPSPPGSRIKCAGGIIF
jgi:hypothetical protein